jgi:hypothetical protein
LSGIDANGTGAGEGTFTFLGSQAFTGIAGELRAEVADGKTVISGELNGIMSPISRSS